MSLSIVFGCTSPALNAYLQAIAIPVHHYFMSSSHQNDQSISAENIYHLSFALIIIV